jgi:hypothetical protein
MLDLSGKKNEEVLSFFFRYEETNNDNIFYVRVHIIREKIKHCCL